MLIMPKGGKGRSTISERFVCISILIPAAVVAVQLVVELNIIYMDLIRTNTDEGTYSDSKSELYRIYDELMKRRE